MASYQARAIAKRHRARVRTTLKLDALDWLIELAKEHTKDRPHARRVGCTGLFAGWCPIHGDCNCPQSDIYFDDRCPLHGKDARVAAGFKAC